VYNLLPQLDALLSFLVVCRVQYNNTFQLDTGQLVMLLEVSGEILK